MNTKYLSYAGLVGLVTNTSNNGTDQWTGVDWPSQVVLANHGIRWRLKHSSSNSHKSVVITYCAALYRAYRPRVAVVRDPAGSVQMITHPQVPGTAWT